MNNNLFGRGWRTQGSSSYISRDYMFRQKLEKMYRRVLNMQTWTPEHDEAFSSYNNYRKTLPFSKD